ncbi:uncharacterized protein LOC108093194 [Drosophila ficusphila]|uniref:uncharacterized protein LOC108093194 n=1 Tax=Drosophila ficusphila TaxID=30025 RepID=UPI0007E75A5C|nr:uncharacterized protein LOC108093194 [Drosophila ficusphila]
MVKRREGSTTHLALLNESEIMERQKKYTVRFQDISAACANFKSALAQFRTMEEERTNLDRWEHFTRCDGLPKVRSPKDIRTFLAKIRHFEDIESSNSIDWNLAVNDRSILTQNIYHKDMTRSTLQKQIVDDPGSYFEKNVNNCLEVLRQVDALMDNEIELERIAKSVQIDIMEVTGDIQKEIQSLIDRLTYRILRMQKAYMNSVNGIVGTWSHSSDFWSMDLWGLYNVPIIFEQLDVPIMLADFSATGVQVQIPLSVLTDCLTLRCVHTSFDHFSENAKSYETFPVEGNLVPFAGTKDMEESVVGEWLMQQDIQEEILDSMHRKRAEYEELMQLIAERTEQAAKEAKSKEEGKRTKVVIPKTPKMVPLVPQGMYPDIYDEFLFREDNQYNIFVQSFFHPDHLNMSPGEINLRECIIIGGVYNISFVRRPDQTQFENFNIILHEDGRILHVIDGVVAQGERTSKVSDFTRMTISDTQLKLDDADLPYFIVTVKLPPELCRWGTPQVCHYLEELELAPQSPERGTMITLNIDLNRISTTLNHHEESIRRSTFNNQFHSCVKSVLKQSNILDQDTAKVTSLKDFRLDKILKKVQMNNLKKLCLPRIISSFNFPIEFIEQKEAQKSKPSRLKKRQETELVEEVSREAEPFDYSKQQRPERVFPVFEILAPAEFRIPETDSTNIDSADDTKTTTTITTTTTTTTTTAYGLLSTLEDIKTQYLERPFKVIDQVGPEPSSKKPEKKVENPVERSDARESYYSFSDLRTSFDKTAFEKPLRSSMKRQSKTKRKSSKLEERHLKTENDEKEPPVMLNHWTKDHIIESTLDLQTNTLTFRTDRLGRFGLAFKRYEHFPFRDWFLQPNEENPDEIILNLETHHVRMIFYISSKGVRGYVTDLSKAYTANPVKYLEIVEPISDFRELRKLLVKKNLNIFAENDASYYITNGYFSIKHVATELHTYNTMALQCKLMKFYRSGWNRLANRRTIIMDMKFANDRSDYTEVTMRITPEKTTFVKVFEMCSDNINVVNLRYEETWRNVNNYHDLGQAISSMNPHSQEGSNKDATLFVYIRRLLNEIRPLSFS